MTAQCLIWRETEMLPHRTGNCSQSMNANGEIVKDDPKDISLVIIILTCVAK